MFFREVKTTSSVRRKRSWARPNTWATLVLGLACLNTPAARGQVDSLPDIQVRRDTLSDPPSSSESAPDVQVQIIVSSADSTRIFKNAHSAQRRFERLRKSHFPWAFSRGGYCDERIGRLCMWYDDDDEEEEEREAARPGSEHKNVATARKELISELERDALSIPGDRWARGQLVRYLVEDGRYDEAITAATRCVPAGHPWCAALTGYSLHAAGRFKAAEEIYAQALAAMRPPQRCDWNDLSPFLTGGLRRAYRRTPCGERGDVEERFWWLADPLYLQAGNDRRSEHYSRLVMVGFQDEAETPFGIPWASDLREVTLRYGWPSSWERTQSMNLYSGPAYAIVAHHPAAGRRFMPPSDVVKDPTQTDAQDWPLHDKAARTEYDPAYAFFQRELEHQLSLFRRGDSTVIVAAFDLARDTRWGAGPVLAGLFWRAGTGTGAGTGAGERTELETTEGIAGGRGVLSLTTPTRPAIISLELLSREAKRAARARYGVEPRVRTPLVLALSDLMLLVPFDSLPKGLVEAIPLARGSARIQGGKGGGGGGGGERIGLYWEIYGMKLSGEALSFSLTIIKNKKNWRRKLSESNLDRDERPMSLNWEEEVEPRIAGAPRALSIELPQMKKGSYILALIIDGFGREPVIASRVLTVER